MKFYVEQREGGYLTDSRVCLESVVYLFRDGASPETIRQEFPTLGLEQIYGAITFYLAHKDELDAYLTETEKLSEERRRDQTPLPADLRERLHRARQELHAKRR